MDDLEYRVTKLENQVVELRKLFSHVHDVLDLSTKSSEPQYSNCLWDIKKAIYNSKYYHDLLVQFYEPFSVHVMDDTKESLVFFRKQINEITHHDR